MATVKSMLKSANLKSLEGIFWALTSVVGIILMGVTYTYIDKLEKIDCACAEHPYKKYIKNYIIFAIIFLLVTSLLPPGAVIRMFGQFAGILYMLIKWVYVFATFIFFVYALQYVRFLMREKCKCSEDVRREVLLWWSIIEIVIYISLIFLPLVIALVSGGVAITLQNTKTMSDVVIESSSNPIRTLSRVPKSLRRSATKAFGK